MTSSPPPTRYRMSSPAAAVGARATSDPKGADKPLRVVHSAVLVATLGTEPQVVTLDRKSVV